MNNEMTIDNQFMAGLISKLKVKSFDIVVTGKLEKPYFSVKYITADNEAFDGFGSYDLKNVFGWVDEYLEVVESDEVKEPFHYKHGQFECIDEMLIVFGAKKTYDFCILNAWKYRNRAPYKGKMDEDLRKADEYLRLAKQIMDCNFEISEIARLIKVGE